MTIIQRTGTKADGFRPSVAFAIEPRGATAAEPGDHRRAVGRGVMPAMRLTLQDAEIAELHRHVQRERTAGLALAIGAIAGVKQQRERRDLIADRAALGADRSSGGKVAAMTGGCQCGAIRYEVASFPLLLYTCNCIDCQRQTGQCVRAEHAGEIQRFPHPAG